MTKFSASISFLKLNANLRKHPTMQVANSKALEKHLISCNLEGKTPVIWNVYLQSLMKIFTLYTHKFSVFKINNGCWSRCIVVLAC